MSEEGSKPGEDGSLRAAIDLAEVLCRPPSGHSPVQDAG